MKEKIKEFLESDVKELKLDILPLDDYDTILSDLGFEGDNENFDTNGWQVDFWWNFEKDDVKLMLSGSLFYGNYQLVKL